MKTEEESETFKNKNSYNLAFLTLQSTHKHGLVSLLIYFLRRGQIPFFTNTFRTLYQLALEKSSRVLTQIWTLLTAKKKEKFEIANG